MSTYFPEEVFRNIASFLVDPYKADRKKHASVWQKIRVKRERCIEIYRTHTPDGDIIDDNATQEDEYYVYTTDMYDRKAPDACIPTTFAGLDNIHANTSFYLDDEFDYDNEENTWYNYAWIQYGMCPRHDWDDESDYNNRVYTSRMTSDGFSLSDD
jgi:hypothetical protein